MCSYNICKKGSAAIYKYIKSYAWDKKMYYAFLLWDVIIFTSEIKSNYI